MFQTLPSLNGLRAFEAVGRLESFSAAAEELMVTHGAVSRLVRALEEQLGVVLLERGRYGARTTTAGDRLLRRLQPAFELMRSGVEEISGAQKGEALTLSCYGTFLMRWLMPRFHRFAERHGNIDVRFISHNDLPDFSDHRYDMAISTSLPERAETLSVTRLFAEYCGPVCRPDVLPEGKRLAARSLVDAPLLHTETRADAWPNWLKMVGNEDVDPRRGQRYEHFYFMLQAAVSGLGVAIGPHPLVVDDLISGQLVAPFGFVESGNHYYFSCREERANDPRIDTFRTWLVAEADSFVASGQLATN